MRNALLVAATCGVVVLSAAAQAPNRETAAVLSKPGQVTVADSVKRSATVEAVDKAKRLVTLKGRDGHMFVVQAGPDVKNFDQIRVGDELVVRYMEALTLELKKGGGAMREKVEREDTVAAKPGEKPGVATGRQVTAIADVIAVDAKRQSVRLRGPQRTVDLKVSDPAQFKLIKVGDQVEATFTEAMALSIEPAPAKK
jgi:hypothetical protein